MSAIWCDHRLRFISLVNINFELFMGAYYVWMIQVTSHLAYCREEVIQEI